MNDERAARRILAIIAVVTSEIVLGLFAGVAAHGQVVQATGPLPSFEVATIKRDRTTGPLLLSASPPNVFQNFNVTVRGLVRVAYGLPPGPASARVVGGPAWIDNNRYDVDAKIPDAAFAEMQKMSPGDRARQQLLMLQSLLAERFKLVAHVEVREMPIYELVVSKGGSKLVPANESHPSASDESSAAKATDLSHPEAMRQVLVVRPKPGGVMELTARGQTIDDLAQIPFFGLSSPVVNKTGLTGKFDFTLDWARDHGTAADATADGDAPPLFTAIQEQLGLKLVLTKGPVEMIVIDRIELPTEN